jgi:hypothetical protein
MAVCGFPMPPGSGENLSGRQPRLESPHQVSELRTMIDRFPADTRFLNATGISA